MFMYALRLLPACAILFIASCVDFPDYSQTAYANATSLKARSLVLVANGTDPYATHRQDAEALLLSLDEAYEFANGIENNNEAAKLWDILRDPNGSLIGGFVTNWQTEFPGGASASFVEEVGDNLSDNFDRLICLEANKREASSCPAPLQN